MASTTVKLDFGVDLVKAAKYHLQFLKCVDSITYFQDERYIKHAIFRYETLWLPFAARHDSEVLAAPFDIEWVWHCHMLCPLAYIEDCMAKVGKLVDHKLLSVNNRETAIEKTKILWSEVYGEETFEVTDFDFQNTRTEKYCSQLSYNLHQAVARQGSFYYQVSLPHYYHDEFLKQSKRRYMEFLFLKKMNPGLFLVPCYDMDLIWHTHQLHPLIYKEDTERILGKLYSHDDTVNNRSENSKLTRADIQTRRLWKSCFGENFARSGSMYRGISSKGKLYSLTYDDNYEISTKRTSLLPREVIIKGIPNMHVCRFIVKLSATCLNQYTEKLNFLDLDNDDDSIDTLCKIKFQGQKWNGSQEQKPFPFNTLTYQDLRIQLFRESGPACLSRRSICGETIIKHFGKSFVDPLHKRQGGDLEVSTVLQSSTDVRININFYMFPPEKHTCIMILEAGAFEIVNMPTDNEQLWGPISFPKHSSDVNKCHVASHRLHKLNGNVTFTCRIIHSMQMLTSAIQVYYHDKMVAVAHLIGSDQLPFPINDDFNNYKVSLNPLAGERAVIVKNCKGDYGILTGCWTGFKKGIPGVGKKLGVPGCPGWLKLKFFNLRNGKNTCVNLKYHNDKFDVDLESVLLDLKKDHIKIKNGNKIAESIALAFCITLLHVLCVPRPSAWKPGGPIKRTKIIRGTKGIKRIPSEEMPFVMATGFLENTPSNHYLYHTYGRKAYECEEISGETYIAESGQDYRVAIGGGYDVERRTRSASGGYVAGCGGCGGCGGV